MGSYREELLAERAPRARPRGAGEGAGTENRTSRADLRRAAAERRTQLAPLRKAAAEAEAKVAQITTELVRIDAALASPELYADAAKAQKLAIDRGLAAKRLADAESAWLAATVAYEDAAREDLETPDL
jgi:ATP-binding cassette subfamily F protein 3